MTALAPIPVRPLGAMERALFESDLGAPFNFTTAARISGPLTAEVVRAALPALRERHLALRWRIARGSDRYPLFLGDDAPPLQLREASGATHVAELENEINGPVDALQGPLGRFVLVDCGTQGRWLLATLHHAIGDGMSGTFLMRDLVAACAQVAAGQAPLLPPLEKSTAIETLLPVAARGLKALRNHLRFLGVEAWQMLRHGRPVRLRRDQNVPPWARRTRVRAITLDAPEAERLTARARAENTTVHGALSAAMLLSLLADTQTRGGSVAFGSPVNVRPMLHPAVGELLGFYISAAAFRAAVRSDTPFWDLARDVRRQFKAELARGGHLSQLSLLPMLGGLVGVGRLEARALVEKWERSVPTTTGLTNLGRLAIETRHGPFTIEACHFAACPSALGDFLATATSLHGRIDWNFLWPDPVITEAHATALTDDAVRRLRTAIA